MLKITTIIILMLIGSQFAASLSCNTCGQECVTACGTRYFRSCCFNYLRRKRDPDTMQFQSKTLQYLIPETKLLTEDELSEVIPREIEHYNQDNRI